MNKNANADDWVHSVESIVTHSMECLLQKFHAKHNRDEIISKVIERDYFCINSKIKNIYNIRNQLQWESLTLFKENSYVGGMKIIPFYSTPILSFTIFVNGMPEEQWEYTIEKKYPASGETTLDYLTAKVNTFIDESISIIKANSFSSKCITYKIANSNINPMIDYKFAKQINNPNFILNTCFGVLKLVIHSNSHKDFEPIIESRIDYDEILTSNIQESYIKIMSHRERVHTAKQIRSISSEHEKPLYKEHDILSIVNSIKLEDKPIEKVAKSLILNPFFSAADDSTLCKTKYIREDTTRQMLAFNLLIETI